MATIKSDNINDLQFYGEYGHADSAVGGVTLAAAQIADIIDLLKLDGPVEISDAFMINAALGAGSTISLGWRYQDGSAGGGAATIFAATATNAAGRVNMGLASFKTTKAIVIYATVGGGAATGRVDFVIRYRALGGK